MNLRDVIGRMTDDQMPELLRLVLDNTQEDRAMEVLQDWSNENGLGLFDDDTD
jgi:hypothetical protein